MVKSDVINTCVKKGNAVIGYGMEMEVTVVDGLIGHEKA